MKRLIFTLSLVLLLAFSTVVAFAQDEIKLNIDSSKVEFNSESGFPFIDENYRTQVPFRATLEKFGAKVDWDNEIGAAVATKGDITVKVPVGEKYILKNGEKIATDTVAINKGNRVYLPIRPVLEAFGSDVQWDSELMTVVIATQPVDAKKLLMDAYAKSSAWKNYDGKITMDMLMSIPDESGVLQPMKMNMKMDMTTFTNPQKVKLTANMEAEFQGDKINQPAMNMYVTADKSKFVTYMGMYNTDGTLTWTKSTIDDESLTNLINYDVKANLEITEKYTKDVKFFGKYNDNSGKTLLRIQSTLSGEIYSELLGTYLEQLASSTNTQDVMTSEMLKNMGDFRFIIYIDEKSGEIVKYEMDLGSIYSSMFSNMTESESMPKELIESLKNIKAKMVMEVININKAKDFEIPKEALNASEASTVLQ